MQTFVPGLSVGMPDGWIARESVVLASPDEGSYVRVTSELVPDALTTDVYADRYGKQLRERLPGYEELAVETVEIAGGRPAILRSFRWTPPEREARAQLHLYAVLGRRAILARAASSVDRFAEIESTLRELLLGVRLGTPASRGGVFRAQSMPRDRTYSAFEAGQLTTTRAKAFGGEARAER